MARVQIAALVVSLALLTLVLELVRRRKLNEEYSFLWIASSLALVGLAVRRDTLHEAAMWLGVFYPPVLLLLALIVMVFVASLSFSVVASRQRQQIERLIEDTAILAAEVRALRGEARTESAAAHERGGAQRVGRGATSGVGPKSESGSSRALQ